MGPCRRRYLAVYKATLVPVLCGLVAERAADITYPSTCLAAGRRARLSSTLSSDSGLDSACSLSSLAPAPSLPLSSRALTVRDADLDSNITLVLRIIIDTDVDEWAEVLTLSQRGDTLTVWANLRRGLKLSISTPSGKAEAQSSLQDLLKVGTWHHLVINLSTRLEGGCSTKTLAAFLDCGLAWEVGLSLERREEARRADPLTLRLDTPRPAPSCPSAPPPSPTSSRRSASWAGRRSWRRSSVERPDDILDGK